MPNTIPADRDVILTAPLREACFVRIERFGWVWQAAPLPALLLRPRSRKTAELRIRAVECGYRLVPDLPGENIYETPGEDALERFLAGVLADADSLVVSRGGARLALIDALTGGVLGAFPSRVQTWEEARRKAIAFDVPGRPAGGDAPSVRDRLRLNARCQWPGGKAWLTESDGWNRRMYFLDSCEYEWQ